MWWIAYGVDAVLYSLIDSKEVIVITNLLASENNYSQLENEALALVFCVKRFHNYIYERKSIHQIDHKPLAVIFAS